MIWSRVPLPVRSLFPGALWSVKTGGRKEVFLTFDDGPFAVETVFVLALMKEYNAKACFFLTGNNAKQNPDLVQQILADGHTLGNHTFSHINGWKSGRKEYLDNVLQCAHYVPSKLFRPPYGKILPSQARLLRNAGYQLVMWDLLSYDFDKNKSPQTLLYHLKRKLKPGAIVVFHDSPKAFALLKEILPEFLSHCFQLGYSFKPLTNKH